MSSKALAGVAYSGAVASLPQPARIAARDRWVPRVKRVVPVVRWAILVRHVPPLSDELPPAVLAAMEQAWEEWQHCYRAAVAERGGLPLNEVEIVTNEKVRLKFDGKTPMLDLPRVQSRSATNIQAQPGSVNRFDLRNCVALCLDQFSSKVWTRVGTPEDGVQRGCPTGELRSTVRTYRSFAKSCGAWFYDEFTRLTQGAIQGRDRERVGTIEITTVGLQVEGIESDDQFDSWLLDATEGPNLDNEDLCGFLADAANLSFHPRELRLLEPDSFWMSLPSAIQLPNGDLASRRVLYLVRRVDGDVQIVGIGLDDSLSGDLAGHVALKISRLVANRI